MVTCMDQEEQGKPGTTTDAPPNNINKGHTPITLNKLVLKALQLTAATQLSGREFQMGTTREANVALRMSSVDNGKYSFQRCPRVPLSGA